MKHSALFKITASLVVFVVVVLLLELVGRLVAYRPPDVLGAGPEVYYWNEKPALNAGPLGDLVPGDSVWTVAPHMPYAVTVDAEGFRNAEPVDPAATKILAVGDSFTFGPYVDNAGTWPAVLERELRNAMPGRRLQVLNAGVAGYGIVQELSYFQEKGLKLKPDLVLLAVNDLSTDLRPGMSQRFKRPSPQPRIYSMLRRSAALRMFSTLGERLQRARAVADVQRAQSQAAPDETQLRAAYADRFEAFVKAARDAHVRLLVVAIPAARQVAEDGCPYEPQAFVLRLASKAEAPTMDLLPAFREHRIDDLYRMDYDAGQPAAEGCFADDTRFVGDRHLARYGNQVTGRQIARLLLSSPSLLTR